MKIILRAILIALACILIFHLSIFTILDFPVSLATILLPPLNLLIFLIMLAIKRKANKTHTLWTIGTCLALVPLLIDPLPKGSYFRTFDSPKWLSENTWKKSSPTIRRQMLGSLYWFGSKNWKEADLIKNLGESSEYFQGLVGNGQAKKVYSYRIDNEDGLFAIDSQWLVFLLTENGEIQDKRIMRD
jgi:hypothetical protein